MIRQLRKSFQGGLFLIFVNILFMSSVSAQTVTSYSPTKGSTPASLAPGSPAGSYALSGFDTLNPYNLSMNFRLPLLQVGGRGEAGYTVMLPIQRKWRVNKTVTDSRIGCEACEEHIVTYAINANSDWWHPEIGEFGPGMMAARYSGFNLIQGCFADSRHWQKALTRLTFTTADGTEYEFRDQNSGGAPLDVPSCNQGASRGRIFVSADGGAATFISDTTIFDAVSPVAADSYFTVSGYLLLRDGTRYRIDEGKVTWIRDRNGNQTRFEQGKIIDALNREITFSYEHNGIGILLAKQIGFKGFNGASRTIRIVYDDLQNALRPANGQHAAETIKTYVQLFPGITDWGEGGNNGGDEFFTRVISRVILPDGRSYRFFYNSYAELARVELPTGGAFEYDWSGDVVNMGGSFDLGPNYEVYRELVEKRVYKDGSTLEGRIILGTCADTPQPGQICRQVDQVDPNNSNALLTRTKHFYFGASGPTGLFKEEIHYSKWNEGKEFKTEVFATNGTTVLQRTEKNWVQRAAVSWWAPGSPLFGPEPANDPRVTWVNTTLPDVNKVARQEFTYDDSLPYNNQSDLYEYDFGTGTPGTLIRRTHFNYVTAANYVGTDGLAVYAGTAAHLRSLPSQRWISSDANGTTKRSFTSYEYDNYATDSTHAGLTPRTDITGLCTTFNSAGVCANTAPQTYLTRGNLTSVTSYTQAGSQTGPVTIAMQYDVAGNTVKFLDARSISSQLYYATTLDYTDRFGVPDHESRADAGAAELNGPPVKHTYAFPTLITNPVGHTTYSQFDYYLGQPVNAEDENGIVASGRYADSLDRPTQLKQAINVTGVETQTTFAYDDVARTITTSSDRDSLNDNILITKVLYDKLGRTIETRQYEGGSNFIATKTEFDALGRSFRTSNPYRPWQSESAVWTTSAVDGLGRVISVTTPDGAVVSTSYVGNTVTVTDQAGKTRKSVRDALGRLVGLYEDPDVPGGPTELNYQTTYTYDVLDNLVKVTQGTQQRFFMYDSLKRLIRARNPEQGTLASLNLSDPLTGNSSWSLGYQYDANSNLTQKTDARGVVSTYVCDALNRNTTIDYSDTASINPDVKRFYDGATNGKGRIWYHFSGGDLSTGSNVEQTIIDSYDALGRPLVQRQLFKHNGTWSGAYQISRTYNRAGAVTSQTYPSGNSVTYNYDAAGRLGDKDASNLAFTGNLGGEQRTYTAGNTYSPSGGLTREKFGTQTPLYHKRLYNIRGQLFDTRLSSVNDLWDWNRGRLILHYSSNHLWGQSGTDNNGNVRFAETWIPPANATLDQTQMLIEQAYSYDALNRLSSVTEQKQEAPNFVWQQQSQQAYSYDRWGNRNINAAQTWGTGINNKVFAVDTATNRLGVPGGQSGAMTYDNAGNLTTDTYTGAGARTYDAENKMTAAQDNSAGWSYYTYNADGQRTRRKINNQETWQIYGIGGELLAEYPVNGPAASPQKEYGYRNGQLLITTNGTTGVLTNFALNKTATQSSTHASGAAASRAVDGNTDGVFANGSVTHTLNDVNAWWQLDLGQVQSIDTIKIWNRVESPERLSNFYLFVSDQPFTSTNLTTTLNQAGVSSFHTAGQGAFPTQVTINRTGRYIRVQLGGTNYLSIAELQVLGIAPPVNVALNKTATQSSTHASGAVASRAVDGNTNGVFTNGSVTHTLNDVNAWWQVDLGQVETIGTIKVWNRVESPERLTNFYVFVSDQPFTSTDLTTTQNQSGVSSYHTAGQGLFPTELAIDRTGRYVRVQLAGTNYLSIAEVQVLTGRYVPAVQWLVPDHLGTPRILVDQTGNLAHVKRHDYLPFGEELFAGTGGRTVSLGYAGGDAVRQQFTQKERDFETGLDYFMARYYSSLQGRFLSPDEFKGGPQELYALGSGDPKQQALIYADVTQPQSLNKYQYTLNNPLRYVDQDGHKPQDPQALDWDIKDLLEGRITEKEFDQRQQARGLGVVAGVAIWAAYYYGPAVATAILTWAARNPDKVERATQELVQMSTGNPVSTQSPARRVNLGKKLEYVLGNATGRPHNIQRSQSMATLLSKIGLRDNLDTRQLLTDHLLEIARTPGTVQENGRIIRESLLIGPGGAVKLKTIWEETKEEIKLITLEVLKSKG